MYQPENRTLTPYPPKMLFSPSRDPVIFAPHVGTFSDFIFSHTGTTRSTVPGTYPYLPTSTVPKEINLLLSTRFWFQHRELISIYGVLVPVAVE
jgi:hypothetical protein